MGYELNRFIGEIDDKFQCSICAMVLEDPVQTPCEDLFCNNCIKGWLAVNQTCPDDRKPLTISDLKPPNISFHNLWNKLYIKCDYEQLGCPTSSKLENLALHISNCVFNSENRKNNCFSKWIDEVSRQRMQQENFENAMSSQQQQTVELSDESSISLRPVKWKVCTNVKVDKDNILKLDDPMRGGYFESHNPLQPGECYFKVDILRIDDYEYSAIGLLNPILGSDIWYSANGEINTFRYKMYGPKWNVGDTIEFRVIFPRNFMFNGEYSARLYIFKNKEIIFNILITILNDGTYPVPAIFMYNNTRLQYCQ